MLRCQFYIHKRRRQRRARSEIFLTVCTRPLQQDIIRKHTLGRPNYIVCRISVDSESGNYYCSFCDTFTFVCVKLQLGGAHTSESFIFAADTQEVESYEESAEFCRIQSCLKNLSEALFVLFEILGSANWRSGQVRFFASANFCTLIILWIQQFSFTPTFYLEL